MKTLQLLALAILILSPGLQNAAFAQINDDCSGAAQILDVANFCSPQQAGNTFFATASPVPKPPCFTNANHDIWFSFTAIATDVSITINGSSTTPGGTLGRPSVALYSGDCPPGQLNLLGCKHDSQFDIAELQVGGLTPGETYYIRVDGTFPGTFQFCIRNYNTVGSLSGDCPTATVLCDKMPFTVNALTGAGDDVTELDSTDCFIQTGIPPIGLETNSSWFVWTAANNGSLTFTLTPNNPNDDLDFVVYRLPNGVGDCTDKVIERCMAAGDFLSTSPCMGPTGLDSASTDFSQPPGCLNVGDDNFLAALDMVAGATYALVVNNFTASGSGFQVEWGGTGEFQGPVAAFASDEPDSTVCLGEEIKFTDASEFNSGSITGWNWNFGKDAVPDTALTQGPHTVQYATEGTKIITLTIKSSAGCLVSTTRQIDVEFCCAMSAAVDVVPGCAPAAMGATATSSTTNSLGPFTYIWSNGQTDSVATNLGLGNYSLIVQDANECMDTVNFPVNVSVVTFVAPNDTLILAGRPVTLTALSSDPNIQVVWTVGNDTQNGASINVSPTDTTLYLVSATSGDCMFMDSVLVLIQPEQFNLPNAFTPNGDGDNDDFYPVAKGVQILDFKIWSRWGNLVYDDPTKGWDGRVDGKEMPTDVYVYHIGYRTFDGQELSVKGDVTLLR